MNKWIIAGAALAATPALALAQGYDQVGPERGDREFTIAGTGASDKNLDNANLGISGELGWYLSRELEVGIRQSVNYADVAGSNDNWNGATRGFVDYHFDLGAFRPFVGASLGGVYGDNVDETGFAGPELGLKYYVLPSTFITARAEYQFFFDSASDAEDQFDDGSWAYGVGVGFNF